MKPVFAATLLALAGMTLFARGGQLSPERLDVLDQRGYFTPDFKAATHRLVNAREAVFQAEAEEKSLSRQLPVIQKEETESQAQTAALHQELAKYDHPEENDFDALQTAIKNPSSLPSDVLAMAQAYVWTYPASPHATEAQQNLELMQKKIADLKQADADANAARVTAHAQLVARAQAHDLNLAEWRDFLRSTSQDDLVKLLGQPSSKDADYWYYNGGWVNKPGGRPKVGLQINFEAGRVITVDEKPSLP